MIGSSSMGSIVSLNCELVGYISEEDIAIEWYRNDDLVKTIPDKYYITTADGTDSGNMLVTSEGTIVQSLVSSLHIYTTSDMDEMYECVTVGDLDVYANFTLDGNNQGQTGHKYAICLCIWS